MSRTSVLSALQKFYAGHLSVRRNNWSLYLLFVCRPCPILIDIPQGPQYISPALTIWLILFHSLPFKHTPKKKTRLSKEYITVQFRRDI
jgi:hypothetical protein